jgi:hypothetical protein
MLSLERREFLSDSRSGLIRLLFSRLEFRRMNAWAATWG